MKDKPGIDEVINDIVLTNKEAEAYRKLKEGYTTLATMPELDDQTKTKFHLKSVHYGNLERDCLSFLRKLETYKEKLEGENAIQQIR